MRFIFLSILLSFGYGKIVFIPHLIDGGEKGILSIHATDINGDGLYCDDCLAQNQGRPWYICRHGNDVSEYMCGHCEMDI